MCEIVITQINCDGNGNDRVFRQWVSRGQVDAKVRRLERAYNMDHTRIETR